MKKTIGGDRLGAGKKMQVDLHNYQRSTHNLSYVWRSSMAAGTLVPFMTEVGLPGDTFDINLDCDIKTHPTIGPLFGSFKVQLDIFVSPIRLYQGLLHNNKLGIGMSMANVKLPQLKLEAKTINYDKNPDNQQINPSCILSYLNIRGLGRSAINEVVTRNFNAVPYIAYWDIYKNYYANKQEEKGAVIHSPPIEISTTIVEIRIMTPGTSDIILPEEPTVDGGQIIADSQLQIVFTGTMPLGNQLVFETSMGKRTLGELFHNIQQTGAGVAIASWPTVPNNYVIYNWGYQTNDESIATEPKVTFFDLTNIDQMRENILADQTMNLAFEISKTENNFAPYSYILEEVGTGANTLYSKLQSQEGLAIKTYQSDLFNNWISTEWIDGDNGINAITAVDTSGGSFTIDTLNLSKKVYDMLNRIAISGGSYDDWMDAVYTHERYRRAESPMYMGGLSKELVFQEVISNAEASNDTGSQPLGTLAGKGVMGKKHKGGEVIIKIDEPSYIMGIISLTPRIDYSQGNKWDVNLKTMDDLHKPALDEIGFQDLITDQMAYWDTTLVDGQPVFKSAGKQPAWINYMTNVNQVRGNFAIAENEMFMTLNRRYEPDDNADIVDLTTYIDPVKFNHIFAQTSRDAQNFWAQIGVNMTARRKMSARVMPNL